MGKAANNGIKPDRRIRDTLKLKQPINDIYVDAEGKVVVNGVPLEEDFDRNTLLQDADGKEYVATSDGDIMGKEEFAATGGNSRLMDNFNKEKEAKAQPDVTFTASQQQKYGFDAYNEQKTNIQASYPELKTGYRPAFKSIKSFDTDRVKASAGTGVTFRSDMGILPTTTGDELNVRGSSGGDNNIMYAYRKLNDTTEVVAGKLNLLSFDEQHKKVYLVPVNGARLPDIAALKNTLNKVYAQAIMEWEVAAAPGVSVAFPNGQMTHGGSNAISVFNADQKAVINTFGAMEKEALYLFFVENVKGKDGDIGGYMPLQRQAGFIYDLPNNELIAHELGHGAFNLWHTFSSDGFIAAQGSTDNLMDYKGGTDLWMHQWKKVLDPERVFLSFLEGEEEGEMKKITGTAIAIISDSTMTKDKIFIYNDTSKLVKVKFETTDTSKTKMTFKLTASLEGSKTTLSYPKTGYDTLIFNKEKHIRLDSIPEGTYTLSCELGKTEYSTLFYIRKQKYEITKDQLKSVFPDTDDKRLEDVVKAINENSLLYAIDTKERMAHFLGQIGAETGGLKKLAEDYSYSAERIFDIFLKGVELRNDTTSKTGYTFKYCDLIEKYNGTNLITCTGFICDSTISVKIDKNNKCAWTYESFDSTYNIKTEYIKSTDLFDYVYGCRMGNGAKSTKDGSTYLGKGFMHITGKDGYKTISVEWNKLYPDDKKEFHGKDINLLETDVEVAMKAAMIFWKIKKYNNKSANEYADNNDYELLTKLINGGTNGKTERETYTKNLLKEFK